MGLNEQFLFDTFNMYYKKGMEAYRQGNYYFAKRNILQASEALLKLAKSSTGELQRARVERANRLIMIAKEIEEKGANAQVFGNVAQESANTAVNKKRASSQSEEDTATRFIAYTE